MTTAHTSRPPAAPGRAVALALAALPVIAAAVIGNLATLPNIPTWYADLAKPAFTPPNGLFGPVWGALYLMMIAAFYRVLRVEPGTPGRRGAIVAFLVQTALNGAWSVAFFAAHAPLAGLAVIAALLVALVVTIARVRVVDTVAAWLLAPYLAWVSFAALLNAAVWWLNR